jgi:hypothetical protein
MSLGLDTGIVGSLHPSRDSERGCEMFLVGVVEQSEVICPE